MEEYSVFFKNPQKEPLLQEFVMTLPYSFFDLKNITTIG
jgi:hypothetical protein